LEQAYGTDAPRAVIEQVRESQKVLDQTRHAGRGSTGGLRTPDGGGSKNGETPLGEAGRQRSDDAEQDSLFGSSAPAEAVLQIEQAVADYKDTLEKDRLTAQLNTPLTREEQLKKLKRSKRRSKPTSLPPTTTNRRKAPSRLARDLAPAAVLRQIHHEERHADRKERRRSLCHFEGRYFALVPAVM
jgi:hypothetical protein